jgi:proline dehydrogenase
MRKHNESEKEAVVYTTIQAYLKDSSTRLGFMLECAQRENWTFACKVVRGAYLVSERAQAEEEHRERWVLLF